jgi:hypothetical protein
MKRDCLKNKMLISSLLIPNISKISDDIQLSTLYLDWSVWYNSIISSSSFSARFYTTSEKGIVLYDELL